MAESVISKAFNKVRSKFDDEFTTTALRVFITVWAIMVIIIVWLVDNKWILAGIAAYEVLP